MPNLSKVAWSWTFRLLAFWGIFAGVLWLASFVTSLLDLNLIRETATAISSAWSDGDAETAIAAASSFDFVMSLASLILVSCAGLLAAFAAMHALAVSLALFWLRRVVSQQGNAIDFAKNYEVQVFPRLRSHPLVGHAWKEFDETLLKARVADGGAIHNTIRPQMFINYGLAREKLSGLKLIGSISGYFVGIGLLLTFIGIVLALFEAGKSVGVQDADVMQKAMERLLSVASFKFSTSIAGLAASILFALFSKILVISIEGSFSRFCEAVEYRLIYTAPQSITAEMHEVGKEQRDQLKEINSDRYFTKLAESVSPLFEAAMSRAMNPVATNIASAVEQLKSTSQNGLVDMTKDFAAALHGNAGVEMKGLQETLRELQVTLADTHRGMQTGGEDFSRRLSEAAENLNRLVGEAGSRLETSAEQSRSGLSEIIAALKQTMDTANARVEAELGRAAAGASVKVEEAMGRVMERLEGQVGSLVQGLGAFQVNAADAMSETQTRLKQVQESAVMSMAAASEEAAKAMQARLGDAFERIATEIDRFQSGINKGEIALSHQASAIGDAAGKTRAVADAFAETAQNIRVAAAPLTQSADRMANATTEMSSAVARSVVSLEAANQSSSTLAQSLTVQIDRLGHLWEGYRAQFDKVDEDLAKAIGALSEATEAQSEKLSAFSVGTDRHLGDAVNRLGSFLNEIRESTSELSESVEKLVFKTREAAE